MKKDIKILLVSDTTHFALTDVYYGYKHALEALSIPHECFPFHNALELVSHQTCYNMMHSRALQKSSGITHVMFIGGLSIPRSILESFYHIPTIVVGTEDPHTFDPLKENLDVIDFYFTNERSVASCGRWENVHYCPTAADPRECSAYPKTSLEGRYRSDIVFLGAMYPNRQKMLEEALPTIRAKGWSFKILGHPGFMDKESPLWEYVPEENYDNNGNIRTIPHSETVKYYSGAEVCLNFFRDTEWNPKTVDKSNPHNSEGFVAESLNPRAYEIPLCGSLQLLEDTRSEAREVFSEEEVGFFSDGQSLAKCLTEHLGDDQDGLRSQKSSKAFMKVSTKHTYLQRLQKVLNIIS
jgi:spore maturation protein CgeB